MNRVVDDMKYNSRHSVGNMQNSYTLIQQVALAKKEVKR